MERKFCVGYSYMGTNFDYDSSCWSVYVFDSQKARKAWLEENSYKDTQQVAEPITRKIALRIVGYKRGRDLLEKKQDDYSILFATWR